MHLKLWGIICTGNLCMEEVAKLSAAMHITIDLYVLLL